MKIVSSGILAAGLSVAIPAVLILVSKLSTSGDKLGTDRHTDRGQVCTDIVRMCNMGQLKHTTDLVSSTKETR